MKRLYLSKVVGTGKDGDEFRPALARFAGIAWAVRREFKQGATEVLVEVDTDLDTHFLIVQDAQNTEVSSGSTGS